MFVLRLAGLLALRAVALSIGLYLHTSDWRYLTWAWRTLQFTFVVVIVAMLLYVLERLVLL